MLNEKKIEPIKAANELTDLAVYVSTKHKEPNEDDFEEGYFNEAKFAFRANNSGKYIYFTLKSEKGCKCNIVLRFSGLKYRVPSMAMANISSNDGEVEKHVHAILQVDPYMMSRSKIEEKVVSELRRYYIRQKELEENEKKYSVNYISQNIKDAFHQTSSFVHFKHRIFAEKDQHKIVKAQVKKNEIIENQHLKNLDDYHRWEEYR